MMNLARSSVRRRLLSSRHLNPISRAFHHKSSPLGSENQRGNQRYFEFQKEQARKQEPIAIPFPASFFEASKTDLPLLKTLAAWLPDLTVLQSKIPRGFKNFYPEEGGGDGKETKKQAKADPTPDGESEGASEGEEATTDKSKKSDGEGKGEDFKTQQQRKKKKKKEEPEEPSKEQMAFMLISGGLLFFFASSYISSYINGPPGREVTYQEFKTRFLENKQVVLLRVANKTRVNVMLKGQDGNEPQYYFNIGSVDSFERQLEDAQYELNVSPHDFVPVQYVQESDFMGSVASIAPHLLLMGVWIFILVRMSGGMNGMGGGGGKNIFSVGKSNAHKVKAEEGTGTKFKDVAGLDEAKVEIMEFVKFLQNPDKFTKLGAKIPRGALLVGPPGTGKTLLAKATAGEASVPFYSISGSDFIEMFVGVGPSRVRDLFKEARADAPCIIFIDEIDAVGRKRSSGNSMGGNDERENTLNQLLVEMDGFQTEEGVVVLAGTNRADILDQALLRPGRFDRQITIDKPDIKGRNQIFKVHLQNLTMNVDQDFVAKRLAALTPGFAGADIANICNEAALIAARSDKDAIELIDFEKAVDRVIGGLEKPNSVMSEEEKRLVAYHEAGHAVVGWFLENADPLLKVTIVPRGNGALGFAQYLPKELSLYQTEQLVDRICMALGGRAAEQVFFGKISTGAADDLKKVTKIAYAQVAIYGMNERVGNVSYQQEEGDSQFTKPYSEYTAQLIDEEVGKLVEKSYARTIALVEEYKEQVDALAQRLLKDETVNHDGIVEVLGDRPYSTPSYLEFVKHALTPEERVDGAEASKDPEKTEDGEEVEDAEEGEDASKEPEKN